MFFFGVFVSMPLVLLLPGPWAVLAATVPMVVTMPQVGHPFLLVLALLESLWLVLARRTKVRSHLVQDFVFWLLVGGPMIVLLTRGYADYTPDLSLSLIHI